MEFVVKSARHRDYFQYFRLSLLFLEPFIIISKREISIRTFSWVVPARILYTYGYRVSRSPRHPLFVHTAGNGWAFGVFSPRTGGSDVIDNDVTNPKYVINATVYHLLEYATTHCINGDKKKPLRSVRSVYEFVVHAIIGRRASKARLSTTRA